MAVRQLLVMQTRPERPLDPLALLNNFGKLNGFPVPKPQNVAAKPPVLRRKQVYVSGEESTRS